MSRAISAAEGLALTDLFMSATAALLMVLAVMRPHKPHPIPVQADLLAYCRPSSEAAQAADETSAPAPAGNGAVQLFRADQTPDRAVALSGWADLSAAPAALGLPPKPYYSIAVVPPPSGAGRLTAACYQQVSIEIARRHNADLETLPRTSRKPRSVFLVSLERPPVRDD